MAWILLTGAIASEVVATSALKLQLQVSVAYAIWSGGGTAAITIIGMLLLNEPLTAGKALGIALVIAGVVALNLAGAH